MKPTQERLKQLLSYDRDTGVFTWLVNRCGQAMAGQIAGSPDRAGYSRITVDGCSYRTHRLAWLYVTGEWPTGFIDHINRVKSDNRFVNLRVADRTANAHNAMKPSGQGVYRTPGSSNWHSKIKAGGKSHYLGSFKTQAEAQEAYMAKKLILHPEFAPKEQL